MALNYQKLSEKSLLSINAQTDKAQLLPFPFIHMIRIHWPHFRGVKQPITRQMLLIM